MLTAVYQSLSAIMVLLFVIGFGVWCSHKGWFNDLNSRALLSKLVNASIPFFLFYSVTNKFSHDQLIELLKYAGVPFVTVAINFFISLIPIKLGLVAKERQGTFIMAFTAGTILFVGVPVTTALFGADGVPFLLVYFFANCFFVWTVGLYCIQLDGTRKQGLPSPPIVSLSSLKMLFSPPLIGFLIGLVVVLASIPLPRFVEMSTKYIGQLTSPLALVFVGMTVYFVGFEKLKKMPLDIWLVLFSCFVLRPFIVYLCTMPLDMEPIMRKIFVLAASMPVTSVTAVLAKRYGGDEEFASEAVGASTAAMILVLPVLLVIINLI